MFKKVFEKSLDGNCRHSLPNYLSWLPSIAPSFSLNGDQVSILSKPEDFYNTLLERCRNAERRIALASLYLGTGPLEEKLVNMLDERLKKESGLQVSILLDANRGSRGENNSRKMLLPLLQNYPQCKVSLFHTPSLRGPLRYLLPQRYNELVGLQHMKLYLFDDNVIISGANLSEDYFTNRQDRYILVSDCKDVADFYWGLVKRVSDVSLGLNGSDELTPRSKHPYKASKGTYISEAKKKIWGYYQEHVTSPKQTQTTHDTLLFPLIELPPLGVHHDSRVTVRLLQSVAPGSTLSLSTGYFNLTNEYSRTILYKSLANYKIIMAHPTANGFLKAGGLASGIPGAYTGLAERFLRRVLHSGQDSRIAMFEWSNPGWTYHAKGLWYTPVSCDSPILTLIGSPNFGARSVSRDLETQIVLYTENERLRKRLREEESSLLSRSTEFTLEVSQGPERRPPLWVLTTMALFKTFF